MIAAALLLNRSEVGNTVLMGPFSLIVLEGKILFVAFPGI